MVMALSIEVGQAMNQSHWCFDAKTYYSLQSTPLQHKMYHRLLNYWNVARYTNGYLTLMLGFLGLFGSIMLFRQIRSNRVFSRRLAIHLSMICIWDLIFLACCMSTYAIPVLIYGQTWYYGPMAYVLYILQPLASFCVLCTIWQVFAITCERYFAVTNPLEQRSRKAQFGIVAICLVIIIGSAILNFLPVPFEREIVKCFHITSTNMTIEFSSLLRVKDDIKLMIALLHVVPDLIFRAPLPIFAIAVLTCQTIRVCHKRQVGMLVITPSSSKSIPLRLSLLSLKFILCNTLYMFNSVLIELFGVGAIPRESSDLRTVDETVDQYMNSFYLTDASNLLLVIHSATNWLLFYNFPKKKADSLFYSTSLGNTKNSSVPEDLARVMLKAIGAKKVQIGREVLAKICFEMASVKAALLPPTVPTNFSLLITNPTVRDLGEKMGDFLCSALEWFTADPSSPTSNMKEECRRIGATHFQKNAQFSPQNWKQIRTISVATIASYVTKDECAKAFSKTEVEEALSRMFNLVLSETRNGVLCANVEANHRASRTSRSSSFSSRSDWRTASTTSSSTSASSARIPHSFSRFSAFEPSLEEPLIADDPV